MITLFHILLIPLMNALLNNLIIFLRIVKLLYLIQRKIFIFVIPANQIIDHYLIIKDI